jgi:hypothetical protein
METAPEEELAIAAVVPGKAGTIYLFSRKGKKLRSEFKDELRAITNTVQINADHAVLEIFSLTMGKVVKIVLSFATLV